MKDPVKLANNLYIIDDFDLNTEERTGTYVLNEQDLTIVETSASPSVPFIKEGLKKLGFSLSDIKYIIVTHIHLDHAGGAGLLLQDCPNAKILVHPKGKRHLIDPSRLIAGARAVYGDKFDALFDPIIPIPEDRIVEMNHQSQITIGENCTLTFYDTPGHANHHFSVYHSHLQGVFTGDTAGVFYPQLLKDKIELYLPSTSPNQFNPNLMLSSLSLFKSLNPSFIFFGHYGMSSNPNEVFNQVTSWLEVFLEIGQQSILDGTTFEEQVRLTTNRLLEKISNHLSDKGIQKNHEVYKVLTVDIEVCSMGLIDYLYKNKKVENPST